VSTAPSLEEIGSLFLAHIQERQHSVLLLICPKFTQPTHSPETQLSILPNRFVTGITRLRFLSKVLLCWGEKTPVLTCAWKHRRKTFYTLFIRDSTNNWLGE